MPVDRAGEIGVRAPGFSVGVEAGVGDVDFMAGAFPWVRLIGKEGVVGVRLAVGEGHDVSIGLVGLVGERATPHVLGDFLAALVGVA